MAVMLLYGGPPLLLMLMFIYGIKLLEKKPNQDPPSTMQKMAGWFLILSSLSIVALFVATFFKSNKSKL